MEMKLCRTHALLRVARERKGLGPRMRAYKISVHGASCGGGVGCVGPFLSGTLALLGFFCSFSDRSAVVVVVHFWTGGQWLPSYAYNLHGEIAVRY